MMRDDDRFDELLDRDWDDVWESLESAPPLILSQQKSPRITGRVPAKLVVTLKEVAQCKALPYHGLARSLVADGLRERRIASQTEELDALGVPGNTQLNINMTLALFEVIKVFSDETRIPIIDLLDSGSTSVRGVSSLIWQRRHFPDGHRQKSRLSSNRSRRKANEACHSPNSDSPIENISILRSSPNMRRKSSLSLVTTTEGGILRASAATSASTVALPRFTLCFSVAYSKLASYFHRRRPASRALISVTGGKIPISFKI